LCSATSIQGVRRVRQVICTCRAELEDWRELEAFPRSTIPLTVT
jgi:hypothetical protein